MRVMVAGTGDWTDRKLITASLITVNTSMRTPDEAVTLVHGGAKGADAIAAEVASELGWGIEMHPANWAKYGKRAGPLRNVKMLESGIDLVLAFHKDGSRGTKHAIETARMMNIPTKVHTS